MDQVDAAMDQLGAEVDRLQGLLAEQQKVPTYGAPPSEGSADEPAGWDRPQPRENE
jgi:hypothetical protein